MGWKDSDWTTAFPTGNFKDKDPWRLKKQTNNANITQCTFYIGFYHKVKPYLFKIWQINYNFGGLFGGLYNIQL